MKQLIHFFLLLVSSTTFAQYFNHIPTSVSMVLYYAENDFVVDGNPDKYTIGGYVTRNNTLVCVGATYVDKTTLDDPTVLIGLVLYGETEDTVGMKTGEEISIISFLEYPRVCETALTPTYFAGDPTTFTPFTTTQVISFNSDILAIDYAVSEICNTTDYEVKPDLQLADFLPHHYTANSPDLHIDYLTGGINPNLSLPGTYSVLIHVEGYPGYCSSKVLDTIIITEDNQLEITDYIAEIDDEVCEQQGGIQWNLTGFPHTVTVITYNDEIIAQNSNEYTELDNGNYQIAITDTLGCTTYTNNTVDIVHTGNCEQFILVIGQEGPKAIHFDYHGEIKIYDKSGILITTLQSPTYWAGTKDQGGLVNFGVYFVHYESGEIKTLKVYQ